MDIQEKMQAEGWKHIPIAGGTIEEKRQEAVDLILASIQTFSKLNPLISNRLLPDEGTEARAFFDEVTTASE